MFSRTVGGAIGVSLLGAVMARILRGELRALAAGAADMKLEAFVQNPEVLLQPAVRAGLPAHLLIGLREALASALHGAFVTGSLLALLALLAAFLLPEGLARDHALSEGTAVSQRD
jgi:hypothetical protein